MDKIATVIGDRAVFYPCRPFSEVGVSLSMNIQNEEKEKRKGGKKCQSNTLAPHKSTE